MCVLFDFLTALSNFSIEATTANLLDYRVQLDGDGVKVEQLNWVVHPRHQAIEEVVPVTDSKSKQVGVVDLEKQHSTNTMFIFTLSPRRGAFWTQKVTCVCKC